MSRPICARFHLDQWPAVERREHRTLAWHPQRLRLGGETRHDVCKLCRGGLDEDQSCAFQGRTKFFDGHRCRSDGGSNDDRVLRRNGLGKGSRHGDRRRFGRFRHLGSIDRELALDGVGRDGGFGCRLGRPRLGRGRIEALCVTAASTTAPSAATAPAAFLDAGRVLGRSRWNLAHHRGDGLDDLRR
jgi:hypothetical protein